MWLAVEGRQATWRLATNYAGYRRRYWIYSFHPVVLPVTGQAR